MYTQVELPTSKITKNIRVHLDYYFLLIWWNLLLSILAISCKTSSDLEYRPPSSIFVCPSLFRTCNVTVICETDDLFWPKDNYKLRTWRRAVILISSKEIIRANNHHSQDFLIIWRISAKNITWVNAESNIFTGIYRRYF